MFHGELRQYYTIFNKIDIVFSLYETSFNIIVCLDSGLSLILHTKRY